MSIVYSSFACHESDSLFIQSTSFMNHSSSSDILFFKLDALLAHFDKSYILNRLNFLPTRQDLPAFLMFSLFTGEIFLSKTFLARRLPIYPFFPGLIKCNVHMLEQGIFFSFFFFFDLLTYLFL